MKNAADDVDGDGGEGRGGVRQAVKGFQSNACVSCMSGYATRRTRDQHMTHHMTDHLIRHMTHHMINHMTYHVIESSRSLVTHHAYDP